ncbi:DUF2795 domain-containing protein [Deinococcus sp. YIM 77859]|uniref:DUF2795 domain-containing protein n=1 Tax=Deinococcus sp. YIM 77859 TaxID=1540221 RepID=UPI000AD40498|nr:DUF2795 domain-containing protein [Deinococcus sp. YIM 77859]
MAKINPIQLQKHLRGVDYPASKRDLVAAAERNGADEDMRAALNALPDEEYQTPADVSRALGDNGGGDDESPEGRGHRGHKDQDDRPERDGDRDEDAGINPIQLQKHLRGVDYPASKRALIEAAEHNGADENVRAALGRLSDEEYQKPSDVSRALGDLLGGDKDSR